MSESQITFRLANQTDLKQIVRLLADDKLGMGRETPSADEVDPCYRHAFDEIQADPNNEIIVGTLADQLIAVLQVTYIPNLSLKGTKRAQIEGVRVSSAVRGQGLGHKLFDFVFDRARARGCKLAQLTTNKTRTEAVRFYENLGFKSTHEGMKLEL